MKTLEQNDEQRLYALWDQHQLEYTLHIHKPLFTVEDGEEVSRAIPGAHTKNLFLKDKKGNFFLVSVLQDKRVNLKQLSKEVGKGGLSFGSPIDLLHKLNLVPGSVTPFGLMNPEAKGVHFILDEDFLQYDYVNFHPLRNDKTAQMLLKDFLRFFEILKHVLEIRVIPCA
jgi:Ala-tRNA(Pro) deacylase